MKIKDFTRMSTYPMYLKWTWFYYCSFFIWIYCMQWTISTEIRVSFVYYIMRPNFTTVYFRLMSKHKTSDMFVYSFHGNMFDISEFIRFVCVIVVNESTMNGKYARTIKFSLCVCFFFFFILLLSIFCCCCCCSLVVTLYFLLKRKCYIVSLYQFWCDSINDFPQLCKCNCLYLFCVYSFYFIHKKKNRKRYLCYIATS